MSKKRLLHGMKRPLALFLALAMALAFVPVVTPTALATDIMAINDLVLAYNEEFVEVEGTVDTTGSTPSIEIAVGLAGGSIPVGAPLSIDGGIIAALQDDFGWAHPENGQQYTNGDFIAADGTIADYNASTHLGKFSVIGIGLEEAAKLAAVSNLPDYLWIKQSNPLLDMYYGNGSGSNITKSGTPEQYVKSRAYDDVGFSDMNETKYLYVLIPEGVELADYDGKVSIEVFGGSSAIATEPGSSDSPRFTIEISSSLVFASAGDVIVGLEDEGGALGSYPQDPTATNWDSNTDRANLYFVASQLETEKELTLSPVWKDDNDYSEYYDIVFSENSDYDNEGLDSVESEGVVSLTDDAWSQEWDTGDVIDDTEFTWITMTVTNKAYVTDVYPCDIVLIPVAQYNVTFEEDDIAATVNITDGTDGGVDFTADGNCIGMIGVSNSTVISKTGTDNDLISITINDVDADIVGFTAESKVYDVTVAYMPVDVTIDASANPSGITGDDSDTTIKYSSDSAEAAKTGSAYSDPIAVNVGDKIYAYVTKVDDGTDTSGKSFEAAVSYEAIKGDITNGKTITIAATDYNEISGGSVDPEPASPTVTAVSAPVVDGNNVAPNTNVGKYTVTKGTGDGTVAAPYEIAITGTEALVDVTSAVTAQGTGKWVGVVIDLGVDITTLEYSTDETNWYPLSAADVQEAQDATETATTTSLVYWFKAGAEGVAETTTTKKIQVRTGDDVNTAINIQITFNPYSDTPDPTPFATVTSLLELTDALSDGKTDITVNGNITLTATTVIPANTNLTIANGKTLTVYGGLTLGENSKVKIIGTLELSVYTLANLTAGTGAGFAFDGGTLKLIANQNATGRLAGLFADADFDLGLYAGAVLNLAGSYGNVDFDWLLSLFSGSGTGAIAITNGVCGVVNNNVTLPGNMTLDVQNGAALQIEDGATLIADGDITISASAEADISGGLTVNGNLAVNGTLEVSGKVTAERGATVSLLSDLTIAAGGTLDLSEATLTTGNIIITLQPGADLNVPDGSGTPTTLTVKDYAGNTLTSTDGNYSVPDFAPIVITPVSGGLGDSFNIAVEGGIDSSELYLIVQFVKGGTVSLAMIAVGAYDHSDGYDTYVSYNDADQVTVWLVYEENVTTIPVWTEPDTGMYLETATYPVPVVTP